MKTKVRYHDINSGNVLYQIYLLELHEFTRNTSDWNYSMHIDIHLNHNLQMTSEFLSSRSFVSMFIFLNTASIFDLFQFYYIARSFFWSLNQHWTTQFNQRVCSLESKVAI